MRPVYGRVNNAARVVEPDRSADADANTLNPHFANFNALVDSALPQLAEIELKVLLVFLRHADEKGVAFPGPALIASKVGCSDRAVYKALASLGKKGFIRTVAPGGGRKNIAHRQVTITRNPAPENTEQGNTEQANSVSGSTETLNGGSLNPERPFTKTLNELVQTKIPLNNTEKIPLTTQGGCAASVKVGKKTKSAQTMPDIPASLNTPEFIQAWNEWQQYRRGIRHPLTPTSARQQLSDFVRCGVSESIERIRTAIGNSWIGVNFPQKTQGAPNGSSNRGIELERRDNAAVAPITVKDLMESDDAVRSGRAL